MPATVDRALTVLLAAGAIAALVAVLAVGRLGRRRPSRTRPARTSAPRPPVRAQGLEEEQALGQARRPLRVRRRPERDRRRRHLPRRLPVHALDLADLAALPRRRPDRLQLQDPGLRRRAAEDALGRLALAELRLSLPLGPSAGYPSRMSDGRSASSSPSPASTATTAAPRSSPVRCATPAWRSSTRACTRRPSRSPRR